VLINGGADDVFFQLEVAQALGTPQALLAALEAIAKSAIDLSKIAGAVVAKGATHVVVMNLPDIGKTPQGYFSNDHGKLLTEVSKLFNATLAFGLELQKKNFGGKVILVDAFSFVDGIVANPGIFGFSVSNTDIACDLEAQEAKAIALCNQNNHTSVYCNTLLFTSSLFRSPATYNTKKYKYIDPAYAYMFADFVHPTTHLNALFAVYVEQQIAAAGW